ncbi:MAG: hypothetical protein IPJ69_02935 [Deltaproteobacteria bacterium]|nr:MAG: hypothetical protein IPJ69_02935 [Deltaproteobacteria bacterium]
MGLRINTNVQALLGQHKLQQTSKKLYSSLERLSTGLRINNGRDDVVGLLKSESLRTQIRGIAATETNLSNAQSLLGIAEGSLAQLTEIGQSLREKALLASDASISSADRTNLTTAISDLKSEYSRLVLATEFDGVKLLTGNFSAKTFQVGPNATDSLSLTISDSTAGIIGSAAVLTSSTFTHTVLTASTSTTFNFTDISSLSLGGNSIGSTSADGVSNTESDESAISYVNAINSANIGVTASVLSNVITFSNTTSGADLKSGQTLKINGTAVASANYSNSATGLTNLISAINAITAQTGVTATARTAVSDGFILNAADGRNIDVTLQVSGSQVLGQADSGAYSGVYTSVLGLFSAAGISGGTDVSAAAYIGFAQRGTFRLTSDTSFNYSASGATLLGASSGTSAVSSSYALNQLDVSSSANATTGVFILDNVIRQLQKRRAEIGSKSNRLDVALAELQTRDENLQSAESKIRDTDIASETAKLTQAQILQQAGVSVLARANNLPQIALTLLQQQ